MVLEYIEKYRRDIKGCIEDLKHKDTFYKQIPNLLTFLRLVGGIPAGLIYYLNPYVSIGVIAFLWFTDAIDGKIAKKFKIQSKLGADMDAFADKIMFLSSSLPLLANVPGLILNFVLEGVISLINVTDRMKGLDTKTVLSGKVKTVSLALTLIFGYLVQFFGMSVSVLNLLIGLTTGFQFIAIKDYIKEFVKMDRVLNENDLNNNDMDTRDDVVLEDSVDKKELTYETTKNLLDELRKEREFYLEYKEPDKVSINVRGRKIEDEKKSNN